jgi:hypothetical protein
MSTWRASRRVLLLFGICLFGSLTFTARGQQPPASEPDDGLRYATIWEIYRGEGWYGHHNQNSVSFQKAIKDNASRGNQLACISACEVGEQVILSGAWQRVDGPPREVRYGLSEAAYQQVFDELKAKDYQPLCVSAYEVAGKICYAAVWDSRPAVRRVTCHNLRASDYQKALDRHQVEGYRLTCVSGCAVADDVRYAAIWESGEGPLRIERHGLSSAEYQKAVEQLAGEGFQTVWVSGYGVQGEPRFAAIWEKREAQPTFAFQGILPDDYQKRFDVMARGNDRLACVSMYYVGKRR